VACPTSTECTAVGGLDEVTFNPRSPDAPEAVAIGVNSYDYINGLYALACPSVSQCTALDALGDEVTFNPRSPGHPKHVTIDGQDKLSGLACPTVNLCVAVDDTGNALQGDPQRTGPWRLGRVAGGDSFTAVACPAAWRCVAVDNAGDAFAATAPPMLTGVRESRRTWRTGTVFTFEVNEPARVVFTVTKRVATRRIVVGTMSVTRGPGHDRVSFAGRLSKPKRRLVAGRYTVLVAAVNSAGARSRERSLTFTVLP
jgi:hypothetical protein